jgi:hypothetical protein
MESSISQNVTNNNLFEPRRAAMTTEEVSCNDATTKAGAAKVEMKLEAVVNPVSDIDRAKTSYENIGWRLDADFRFDNGFRVVQYTPPGSKCSVQFGSKATSAIPGSAYGLYLIVSDMEAARGKLVANACQGQRGLSRRDARRSISARAIKQSLKRPCA